MYTSNEFYITPKEGNRILYDGNFDFKKIISTIKTWYRGKKFILTEKEYTIKDKPAGNEVEITWNGERKRDEHTRFRLNIDLKINEMKKAEKLDHGSMYFKFTAYLEFDYKKRFDSWLGKYMLFIYNNYIIKHKLKNYEDQLDFELTEIHNIIKDILDIYS